MPEPLAAQFIAGMWAATKEVGQYIFGLMAMIWMSIVWAFRRTIKDYPTRRETEEKIQQCRTDVLQRMVDNHQVVLEKIESTQFRTSAGLDEVKNLLIQHMDKH